MKKKWIVFALVLMIALAMFMTACEDKNQPEESTDPQQEQTVDPGTDPSVNPNTDPTVKPDGDKKDEEKVDEKEDEEEEPYPEISKEDAEKKFKEQFTSFVNGENPIVNSVVNFINGIRYPDASRLLHRPKGNKEATIASLTYYFSESGISPYAIDRMLEDLQPLYDLFTVPAETPAETTTESTPANASGRSGAIESPVPSILAAKASVDLLLAPGNIDIVCDSINNFIKHLPVDGLLKLYGANLKGINDSRSYSSMYGDYTEQQFIEFFGENSAMVAALLDFDNCAAQKFAQKDCVKGTITDILGATKVVVTGNKAEVKNILTSASAALDYLADMDWAFLNEIPGLRNVTPVLSPGYIKYAIRMSYPYVLSKVLPDLSDVSLLNDLGKIVISVAEYLGTTDFDTDLQKTIAYHRAYSDYEFYDTDLTGLTTGIKAIGSVLKNATVDFIQINYRDVSAFLSVKKNKDATEEEEKAATDAICRVYVRASGLLYPIYAQLDDNIKAILEAKVAPLFAGAVDEDGKSVSITLASMLAALGTKPLYEDLSEEDVAKLTENDQDKYIHQEAAALYFSTTFENFRKEEEFRPGIKTPYEKMAFNYVLLPLNVTEKAIVTDALMKAMVTLEYYAEKDVVPCGATYTTYQTGNGIKLWTELGDDWSFSVDTTKPGFTTLTVTYHVDESTAYSFDLNAYVVAENNENVFFDYYNGSFVLYACKLNTDMDDQEKMYSIDSGVRIYDKETLMFLGNFRQRYPRNIVNDELKDVIDTEKPGTRGNYFTYNDPVFGELKNLFTYHVYDPDNLFVIYINLDLPEQVEVDSDTIYASVDITKDDRKTVCYTYAIKEGENGELIIKAPDKELTIERFSISGFTFTHEVGEQTVTITFDDATYTAIIKIVEQIDYGPIK